MITANYTNLKCIVFKLLVIGLLLAPSVVFSQEREPERDSTATGYNTGKIALKDPSSIVSRYTYDPLTNMYVFNQKVGEFNINYPLFLTPAEFEKLVKREQIRSYYKQKIDAQAGQKEGTEEEQKNLLPNFYINSGFFSTLFGGDNIEVIPQGSVEVDLGVLFTQQDNPNFSPQNRSNFTFDFNQRISLSLLGKVGTRLQVTANYDTQSTFDFQNLIKLEYTPTEDDIIRKIEVGNVNMPLNSSLIRGAQSLFGVKTELQFGKTRITAVFSEQQSQSTSVVAQGGGTLEEFEFFGQNYDENRHFFLSQYFRNTYDEAMLRYPFINNNIQITRLEVWVTNRNNATENVRNIVAFQDLGESDIIGLPNPPGGFVNVPAGSFPDNRNNDFNPTNIGGAGSLLTPQVRDITTTQNGVLVPVNEGFDYGKMESARKLNEGNEYFLNQRLGYISLNQRLLNDEVLAVAFQYTVGGQVYQVGEFANDGVNSSDVVDNTNNTQNITNNALVLKMLKSAVTVVDLPIWDLMMKNVYDTGAFQLEREDFRLNIFYNEASPLNYIRPVEGTRFPVFQNNTPNNPNDDSEITETPLIRLFHLDRLNFNNDPQEQGDGFFDYVEGLTVLSQNGKIIFTKVEPFGKYLFDLLDDDGNPGNNAIDYETRNFNPNQSKYVYDILYKSTKIAALDEAEKNKFLIKGRFQSAGGGGIPLNAFNVPRGSVVVTAGGRTLVEGIDYTVDYQLGRVNILDEALKASNTPINVSVENNAVFGQQTRRFAGFHVDHEFNENFVLGATFLNLSERPITQKADFNQESVSNSIFGFNGNYSTEVPFLTRMVNKLPNIDTDVPSNLSIRGEFAYLAPGAPKGTDFDGEATSYIDDFEGTQGAIDLKNPLSWFLSSRPVNLFGTTANDVNGLTNGYGRALMNWYTIDPIFYGAQRPEGITNDDVSNLYTRRVFIEEIFPEIDIVQGQTSVTNTLDLTYYPSERGPYNFDPQAANNTSLNPNQSWAGISRAINTTDFEQANVEFIEFWLQDPFLDNPASTGGTLTFNLGNISEDILKDGKKMYENGLPENGDISFLQGSLSVANPYVVPQAQSLIYTFSSTGQARINQDVGYDGYNDQEEQAMLSTLGITGDYGSDPANDNYEFYLNAIGSIFDRYKRYNGIEGNSPSEFSNFNRGAAPQPDAEDINRDNTMNTIDSYFEYEIPITPNTLSTANPQINDLKVRNISLPNGDTREVRWYQFRIPISEATNAVGGIADIRSIRFARMYLTDFSEVTTLRFATLDLVRSDWRRYRLSLDDEPNNDNDNTAFNIGVIGIQENDGTYVSPPGVVRERLNNNNTIVRQNEQSLVLQVCDLEPEDSRGVFKNVNLDMRQYKKMRMFLHAKDGESGRLSSGDMVAFIRMGNDFTENFYQVELPLEVNNGSSPEEVWVNEINIQLNALQEIKSRGIANGTLSNLEPTWYDVTPSGLVEVNQFDPHTPGQQRIAIKGNPNFGDIRVLMLGLKNPGQNGLDVCGEVWFNELRLSEIDSRGGWAGIVSLDSNIADFANISATGRRSTTGFGSIEQKPNERSREDIKQYDLVTNLNLGQLLPKKWGIQLPFNYAVAEEIVTPEFDEFYRDIRLETQLNNTNNRDSILNVNESYTKRKSINFIGVRKLRTGDGTPRFYDVENLTFNYSYNKVEFRDFEIENSLDQNIRAGVNYNFSFNPVKIEPFKKNDSLFRSKYLKLLKDFNFNLLPTSFSVNTDFIRQFSRQKFREVELGGDNIGIEELFRRNYNFNLQYVLNYNITDALNLNFTANNSNIVRNYFIDNRINGRQDPSLNVWDDFFDLGDPNIQNQQLQLNYELPLNKIPTLGFIRSTYAYTGNFQWTKGSDINSNLEITNPNGTVSSFDLGNSIQNANTHNLNTTLNMETLYRYLGLVKKSPRAAQRDNRLSQPGVPQTSRAGQTKEEQQKPPKKPSAVFNTVVDIVTMVKRVQVNYSENNGTFLPGYLRTPGIVGTLKPTIGYTFGAQRDIRQLAARNGWLTVFPDFNQQYTEVANKQLDYSASVQPLTDFTIDVTGGRIYAENNSENFRVEDISGDGQLQYKSLISNSLGNFNISTIMIGTAFQKSDEFNSQTFQTFRENRLTVANRLAREFYGTNNFATDADGFPLGFSKNSQRVLLPAFLAAYQGSNPESISTGAFRNFPLPNWNIKYTGFMRIKWFKDNFRRFSINHGYRSSYTINQFIANLDYVSPELGAEYSDQSIEALNQNGDYKNETLLSNINLEESFSPLMRLDMEMKNSVKILAEIKRDRILSLSFDNNLLTEIQGQEYTLGLGYRVKDVRIRSKIAGPQQVVKSDLNMRADISVRDNKTIIRPLDVTNSQVTAGQTIWNVKYTADYAFSKYLTAIFYFDYAFSDFAISTAFPQTSIRTGFTLRYNFGN